MSLGAWQEPKNFRFSEVLSALSFALDMPEGQPEGHTVRSCLIGMRVAERLGLGEVRRSALFYALLLKDAGCSRRPSGWPPPSQCSSRLRMAWAVSSGAEGVAGAHPRPLRAGGGELIWRGYE